MKKSAEIDMLIASYEQDLSKIEHSHFRKDEFNKVINLNDTLNEIEATITEINRNIDLLDNSEESEEEKHEKYYNLVTNRRALIENQKQIREELEEANSLYAQKHEEAQVEVEKLSQDLTNTLREELVSQLSDIEEKISLNNISLQTVEHNIKFFKREFRAPKNGLVTGLVTEEYLKQKRSRVSGRKTIGTITEQIGRIKQNGISCNLIVNNS